jgi:hypothetical protein
MSTPATPDSPKILMGSEKPRFCTIDIRGRAVAYCTVSRIRRNSVVSYSQCYEKISPPPRHKNSLINLQKDKLRGQISQATSKKCRAMLQQWRDSLACAVGGSDRAHVVGKRQMAFVTVTLCADQVHDDNYIKRHLLYGFIRDLQRYYGVVHYYWRAEAQSNKRIHFHLIIDGFVDKSSLDREWFKQLANHGYLQAYQDATGSLFPPSVNVTAIHADGGAFDYVVKYATKTMIQLPKFAIVEGKRVKRYFYVKLEDYEKESTNCVDYRSIEGRDWGCSDGLRLLVDYKVISSDHSDSTIMGMVLAGKGRTLAFDRVSVVVGDVLGWLKAQGSSLYRGWVCHFQLMFKRLYLDYEWTPPPYWFNSDQCVMHRWAIDKYFT